ncbi:hypothetical protein I6J18_05215 [Peribacillus psychrosaccharolyticus]|uniref:Uncharacterized protein n=1 Tax=Peribacillus psychrosaccharolyticus TaxID=1407 RepID=A0A974NNS2_PERPY|nr:hypothetical protein [Peribacillus psychrosaccharolyticus]MEC2054078.1 hypothetical protein [Peribacillus psychrosaccharolyticus]MED3742302.1 hypothetical protein [Peribacillus psychrosaccharolyticus]QQT01279.1 hypothetical protein I6J18_05215 [Peribacillus psychrosaccharolyticus]
MDLTNKLLCDNCNEYFMKIDEFWKCPNCFNKLSEERLERFINMSAQVGNESFENTLYENGSPIDNKYAVIHNESGKYNSIWFVDDDGTGDGLS